MPASSYLSLELEVYVLPVQIFRGKRIGDQNIGFNDGMARLEIKVWIQGHFYLEINNPPVTGRWAIRGKEFALMRALLEGEKNGWNLWTVLLQKNWSPFMRFLRLR